MSEYWVDLSGIRPFLAGGVERVGAGLTRSMIRMEPDLGVIVKADDVSDWILRLETVPKRIHIVGGLAGRRQARLKRLLSVIPGGDRLAFRMAKLRDRSAKATDLGSDQVVWYPFHRRLVGSRTSVVTCHDLRVFETDLMDLDSQAIITENLNRCTAVIASWNHPFEEMIRRFPQVEEKAFLIPLPVLGGAGQFRDIPRPPGSTTRILVPASMSQHKNHELVVGAMAHISSAEVIFTGHTDPVLYPQLKKLAQDLGVFDRVRWVGYLDDEALDREYGRADIVVMPSRWEAASGPVFEAVARGIPAIACDVPPLRAQVRQFELEVPLVDPNRPEELARAIAEIRDAYTWFSNAQRPAANRLAQITWESAAEDYLRVMSWAAERAIGQ